MIKPIFEAGDFVDWGQTYHLPNAAARIANAKLSSLGIDAETPEKLKRLEHLEKIATSLEGNALAYQRMDAEFELLKRNFNSLTNKMEEERAEIAPLLERLSELERMIAEGPIVYANCMRTFGDSDPYVFELDSDWSTEKSSQDTHRARLVQIESLTK